MKNDDGRKSEGAPERSPKAGERSDVSSRGRPSFRSSASESGLAKELAAMPDRPPAGPRPASRAWVRRDRDTAHPSPRRVTAARLKVTNTLDATELLVITAPEGKPRSASSCASPSQSHSGRGDRGQVTAQGAGNDPRCRRGQPCARAARPPCRWRCDCRGRSFRTA